ncbi:hypothetical protein KDH_68230 [Dictyobacter sp. S3.2.2.5]|uniref:EamA domain-containing protein n=1 Tax=Dictyobacter halimunensis TaxID=3026934 RepID=A0ABQ6G0G5_9CHLR|nr:hypothetical protein KDH_68230 [Dictyobacter sp. S3.2.2.5]
MLSSLIGGVVWSAVRCMRTADHTTPPIYCVALLYIFLPSGAIQTGVTWGVVHASSQIKHHAYGTCIKIQSISALLVTLMHRFTFYEIENVGGCEG